MKIVLKLIYNSILGIIALFLINLIGSLFGFSIAVNLVTVLVTGFLGLPGVVLLIVLKHLILV